MDFFAEVRRLTITALFADDRLMDQIVLKGGNALNLVYGLSTRTSVDIDFPLAGDFDDFEETKQRIFHVLRDRFDSAGYVVFDERFDAKPRLDGPDERPWWGGYELRFKLLSKERYQALKGNLIKMQIDAIPIGPDQMRTFSVDFSKHEYTEGKQECEFDDYAIYVYTPAMLD
jgi:hypothetical protein